MSQKAPPTPTDPAPTDSAPSPKQMRAAAQLAIWGVCRTSGDDYLACVALRVRPPNTAVHVPQCLALPLALEVPGIADYPTLSTSCFWMRP